MEASYFFAGVAVVVFLGFIARQIYKANQKKGGGTTGGGGTGNETHHK